MPLTLVHMRTEDAIPDREAFAGVLQGAIAMMLSVPGTPAELAPSEVDVIFRVLGPHDRVSKPVAVTIFANWYEERARRREESAKQIADAVGLCIPHAFGVHLVLAEAGYYAVGVSGP